MPTASLSLALSDYLTQTRRLLRDASGTLYSDPDLTEFINRAIRQRDLDLGMNRVRLGFTLTANVFDYSFNTIVSSANLLDGKANAVLQDVLSIIVIPLGTATSSVRYPLGRWPYSKLAYLLSTSMPTYPVVYAMYGPSNIMLAPPPAQNYPAEFDFVAYSPDLVNTTDVDLLPYPWTDPVPFLAASFAKMQAQRFDEAKGFADAYTDRMRRVQARARPMAVVSPWSDLPMR